MRKSHGFTSSFDRTNEPSYLAALDSDDDRLVCYPVARWEAKRVVSNHSASRNAVLRVMFAVLLLATVAMRSG